MPRKPTTLITDSELDELVEKVYERPYAFQQQQGCQDESVVRVTVPVVQPEDYSNTSLPEEINGKEMGVRFSAWLARDPKEWGGKKCDDDVYDDEGVELFWQRNFYPHLDMVLNDLHARGHLPAGKYAIEIYW